MLFFRLWLLIAIFGVGWSLFCFAFTRQRRFLGYIRRIVIGSAVLALVLTLVWALVRHLYN